MIKKYVSFASLLLLGFVASTKADTIPDPLHGFCYGSSTCADNGTNTPTSTDPPSFGFDVSPGPQTGTYFVDFLVQDNSATGIPASIAVSGTQGGASNTSSLSGTATLVSTTPYTSGTLESYLGNGASPTDPFGSFILDPGSTGFYVFQVNLGTNQLYGPSTPTLGPLLSLTSGLPTDSYIVGFLDVTGSYIATASSGDIYDTGSPSTTTFGGPPAVPEPSSLILLGTGTLAIAGALRRRLHR